ncbi:hypothetical protein [Virgibacillus necropolis]
MVTLRKIIEDIDANAYVTEHNVLGEFRKGYI